MKRKIKIPVVLQPVFHLGQGFKYMHYRLIKNKRIIIILLFIFFLMMDFVSVQAEESVIIVIDPGHGGENLGAEYGSYTEKEMTMVVAKAMKEELEKYDGVTVYLTHESTDTDMSLKERAEFAKDKNADFLYCLHFNMSLDHNLFGAEVWVSAFDNFYARGYAFAEIEMNMLSDMGLYSRGIKTRLNDKGEDYYGIIRESLKLDLDTVLIEHCHLDQARDQVFYTQGDSQLEALGRLDATAAAKYFRLQSSILGVDYSDYPVPEIAVPTQVVKPDLTPPDVCISEMDSLEETTGKAVFTLTAQDYESNVLYYTYSLDGGASYADLEPFPQGVTEVTFTVDLPFEKDITFSGAAFNAYDRITESDTIEIPAIPKPPEVEEKPEEPEVMDEISLTELAQELESNQENARQGFQTYQIIMIIVVSLMVLVMAILVSRIILFRKRQRKYE